MSAIVFALRGCSAHWLGAYGNESIATPNLDRLAAEGIVFDRHISDCPDPVAASRAWLTGQAATGKVTASQSLLGTLRDRGVPAILVRANHPDTDAPDWFYADWAELFDVRPQEEDRFPLDSLVRSLPALLDRLKNSANFLLWIEIDVLLPPWQIRQDVFEAYVEDTEEEKPWQSGAEEDDAEEVEGDSEDESEADEVEEAASEEPERAEEVEGVSASAEAEPVTPWNDPPTGLFDRSDAVAREWLYSSLSALVTGIDAVLGVVFAQLRERGFDRSAAWIVTSDFGYPLGEHGQIGRFRPWLYEELVHLPLILRLPGAEEACRRVASITQPQDLCPTLHELLEAASNQEWEGAMNLLPLARGKPASEREIAITKLALGDAEEAAIRTEEWAYLLPLRLPDGESREPQLFSKPDDRWEVNDLRGRNMGHADELDEKLQKYLKQLGET